MREVEVEICRMTCMEYLESVYGGASIVHNWDISRKLRDIVYLKPIILARGLNHRNVRRAIEAMIPYAVDASSRVEAALNMRNPQLMEAFIEVAWEIILENNDYEGW